MSALLNLARILGGFSVAYFQVPWATKNGALQTFGVEAAIVVGLFILVVPAMQIKGGFLRVSFFQPEGVSDAEYRSSGEIFVMITTRQNIIR